MIAARIGNPFHITTLPVQVRRYYGQKGLLDRDFILATRSFVNDDGLQSIVIERDDSKYDYFSWREQDYDDFPMAWQFDRTEEIVEDVEDVEDGSSEN